MHIQTNDTKDVDSWKSDFDTESESCRNENLWDDLSWKMIYGRRDEPSH